MYAGMYVCMLYVSMCVHMCYVCIKFDLGAGEMVRWLRALTALPTDLGATK